MSIPSQNPYTYQGSLAQGERARIVYVAETTPVTTPTNGTNTGGTYNNAAGSFTLANNGPTMKVLRATSRNINATKNILKSNEVRADRQVATLRHGMQKVEGTIGTELGLLTFDDLILAGMSAPAWSAYTLTGGTATANTTGFARGSGSFIVDGFRPGDIVTTAGFGTAANNGLWRVTAVTATTLTVDTSIVAPTTDSGGSITVTGKRCDIGTKIQTFTMERQFLDTGLFQLFSGVAIDGLQLKVAAEQIPTMDFPIVGIKPVGMTTNSAAGAITEAATNDPFMPFAGNLYEGGTNIAIITGLNLTLANGRSTAGVIGSYYSPTIFEGQAVITGTLSAFVKDAVLFNKFLNETPSSLYLQLFDADGVNFHNIVCPRIKYTGDTMDPPQTGGVVQSMPFQALVDPVTFTSMWYQKSNTP